MADSGSRTALSTAESIAVRTDDDEAVLIEVTGNASYDGTVDFQASVDGVAWTNTPYINIRSITASRSVAQLTPSTRTEYLVFPPLPKFRIEVTAACTGNLDAKWRTIKLPFDSAAANPLGGLGDTAADGAVTTTDTQMAYIKQLITGVVFDGVNDYTSQFSEKTLAGAIFGQHQEANILFVIPEAVGSINTHNTAIQTEIKKYGHVDTIVQTDALTYPDFSQYNFIVCGTDNGTAWTLSNLDHIKEFPEAVLCVDEGAASQFKIGAIGGDAASKTVLVAITQIEANDLGIERQ